MTKASVSGNGVALVIDREQFLFLVLALGAQGCASAPPAAAEPVAAPLVIAPLDVAARDGGASPALLETTAPESPSETSTCDKDNDTGDVDCSKFPKRLGGPSCEGVKGTCELLASGSGYRPRAAAVIAACFTKLGTRACDVTVRRRCYEEGVKAACPEPRFAAACEAKMEMCRRAGVRIQYTKDDCIRALSAQKPSDRDWAISAMGPSAEGKCKLMFTVY